MIPMYKVYRVASVRYCAEHGVRSVDMPTLKAWFAGIGERERAEIIVSAM